MDNSGRYILPRLEVPLKKGTRVDLQAELCGKLSVSPETLVSFRILRRSVDARRKNRIFIVFKLEVRLASAVTDIATIAAKGGLVHVEEAPAIITRRKGGQKRSIGRHPVVVGTGPAGLFAALALAGKGYRPLVVERGGELPERIEAVTRFWKTGSLEPDTNVQFGEGGAGTFSDGKLTSRSRHPLVSRIFDVMVECGAPGEILYEQKPHLGTERVRAIVRRLRRRIQEMGGSFLFNHEMKGLLIRDNSVKAVEAGNELIDTGAVFLAMGHSARDSYRMLLERGVMLEAKAFAVGLRVEHEQTLIDGAQYGTFAGHPELGAADYRLTWQDRKSGRGVYSFCNCPGGVIIAAASEPLGVVTNGMSRYRRDSGNSNSAIVVTVAPKDFPGTGPLAGVKFQRGIERKAFEMAGGGYLAPAQRTRDFLLGVPSQGEGISASYTPGVVPSDLARLLPASLRSALKGGIRNFTSKIKGFDNSVLVGPETRTSSPVRIIRDKHTLESVNVRGLYPIGEGSGYAGGIVSSAVDGLKAVENIEPYR